MNRFMLSEIQTKMWKTLEGICAKNTFVKKRSIHFETNTKFQKRMIKVSLTGPNNIFPQNYFCKSVFAKKPLSLSLSLSLF